MTDATTPPLDLYDVAFLAGGVRRVVDTALVAMVESGRIRVHSPGQLAVAEPTRRHPVEAAVQDAVGIRGHRSTDVIRWRLGDDDRVLAIGRRLTAQGLISRWSPVLRRGDRPPLRTAAGRRSLRALRTEPPTDRALDGGSAVLVALHGRDRLGDALLRASVFEAFPTPSRKERAATLQRRMAAARNDPSFQGRIGGVDAGGGGGGGDGG